MDGAPHLLLLADGCAIRDAIVGSWPDDYLEGTWIYEVPCESLSG